MSKTLPYFFFYEIQILCQMCKELPWFFFFLNPNNFSKQLLYLYLIKLEQIPICSLIN
jgi:hypothetical protein